MVYSSSSYIAMTTYDNAEHYFIRQSIFVGLGLGLFVFTFLLSKRIFRTKRIVMIAVGLIMFSLIWLLVFGKEINGAKGWIELGGPFNLQPAEFTKLVVIWYFAYVFSIKQKLLVNNFKQAILKPGFLVIAMIFLIFLQPDVGNAAIIFMIGAIMLFSSGAPLKFGFSFTALVTLLAGGLMWVIRHHREWVPFLADYQYNRFLAYWDPFELAESTGMQLVNSYYALSRGGLLGVGLGESVQKTGYLPFPYTDFIMSIVGEELGLVGILVIVGVFIFLVMRIYLIGIRTKNPFHALVCIGIASMMLVQGFINLGGLLGLMPITGVTFPFISYGGSSTIVLAISMGVVCNITATELKVREAEQGKKPSNY